MVGGELPEEIRKMRMKKFACLLSIDFCFDPKVAKSQDRKNACCKHCTIIQPVLHGFLGTLKNSVRILGG